MKNMTTDPSQERLKELFNYNPDTGLFTRLKRVSNSLVGSICSSKNSQGYVLIRVDGVKFKAHRLAFIYMDGAAPEVVDHVNRNKSDNRWINLRGCSKQENCWNRSLNRNNSTTRRNVYWSAPHKKWRVLLKKDRKPIHIGVFQDLELAELVAQMAREKYFKEFA